MEFVIDHTDNFMNIKIGSKLKESADKASWGIRDFYLYSDGSNTISVAAEFKDNFSDTEITYWTISN